MDKEFLKKCWKHPRWHSLMVLIIWIVSLTLLMGIFSLLGQFSKPKGTIQEKKNETNTSEMRYAEKWNRFSEEDYAFIYTITSETETIKYEGTVKDEIITGYRERKDGIIKYSIEDNIAYVVLVEEKKETQTLYENVNPLFLNPLAIYETIQNISASDTDILEEEEKTTYEYIPKDKEETLKITVIAEDDQIKNITIITEKETYILTFAF